MTFWDDYRAAWRRSPRLAVLAVIGALFVLLGVVGTIDRAPVAVFFIPGLICLIGHHLMVQRQV